MDQHLAVLHERNVADVNARTLAAGRCLMHNSDVNIPARFIIGLPIGNEIPLCAPCWGWWQKDQAESPDPLGAPEWIREISDAAT